MSRLLRIEALFGNVSLGQLVEENINALVAGSVREDTDLDFKIALYGNSDTDKRDLAGDIVAMANTIGGAIILGVGEVNAVATTLEPVDFSDGEELRMRQIVAGNVAPHVGFEIHQVPIDADPTKGYYVIEVPPSSSAPHAVVVNKGLRYPKRHGASTRWLAESEVADTYRSRFAGAREQVERLVRVRDEGESALPAPVNHLWLTVAMVPNLTGEMEMSGHLVESMSAFPRRVVFPSFRESAFRSHAPWTRAGYRRVVLNLGQDAHGSPYGGMLHLHQDGSAFVSVRSGRNTTDDAIMRVNDLWLTQEVIASVAVAAAHAVHNCRAAGEAAMEATLVSQLPMVLQQGPDEFDDDTWDKQPVSNVPVGQHTIALDDVLASPQGLLVAARLVLTDIFQGLGIAESPQITPEGGIRIRYFGMLQERVRAEADRLGIHVTDATVT